jgi:hypothetical protein
MNNAVFDEMKYKDDLEKIVGYTHPIRFDKVDLVYANALVDVVLNQDIAYSAVDTMTKDLAFALGVQPDIFEEKFVQGNKRYLFTMCCHAKAIIRRYL